MRFVSSSIRGWRPTMEDEHICSLDLGDGNSLFGVFDGHGGRFVATFIKDEFEKELLNCEAYKTKNYPQALRDTFMNVDMMIKQTRRGVKTGATCTIVLFTKDKIYTANSGDSRSILRKIDGTFEATVDHTPKLPVEKARIEQAGGYVAFGRVNAELAVSRALGDHCYKINSTVAAKD